MEEVKPKRKISKSKTLLIVISLIAIVLLITGVTYAYLQIVLFGNKEHSISTGEITFTYIEDNTVTLESAKPMSDKEGIKKGGEFTFKVSAASTAKNNVKYVVYLTKEDVSNIDSNMIRAILYDKNGTKLTTYTNIGELEPYDVNNSYVMYYNEFNFTGSETKETEHSYVLKFWLDEDFKDTGKHYVTEGNTTTAVAGQSNYSFKVNVATVQREYDIKRPPQSLTQLVMKQKIVNEGNGLYVSNDTNSGDPTYYYHGNVDNNYVQLEGVLPGKCYYKNVEVMSFVDGAPEPMTEEDCLSITSIMAYPSEEQILVYAAPPAAMCPDCSAPTEPLEWRVPASCVYNDKNVIYGDMATGNIHAPTNESECQSTNICSVNGLSYGGMVLDYVVGVDAETCAYFGGSYLENTKASWQTDSILWRVVRVNEDGTVRLITDEHQFLSIFNPDSSSYENLYFTNTNIRFGMMPNLAIWYERYLKAFDDKIATSTYCEQAKLSMATNVTFGNVEMIQLTEDYTPTFKCVDDANGYGLISDQKIGLLTVDEFAYANDLFWDGSLSSTGGVLSDFYVLMNVENEDRHWFSAKGMLVPEDTTSFPGPVRPVINVKADVVAMGEGTKSSPWVISSLPQD